LSEKQRTVHKTLIIIAIVMGCFSRLRFIVLSLNNLKTNRSKMPNINGSEGKLIPNLKSGLRKFKERGVAKTINQSNLSKEVK
jgi:hypothetical protein